MPRSRRPLWPSAALCVLLGCATAQPRFPSYIAAGFAQEPMRHLQTAHVEMYYPGSQRAAAEHTASRLDECVVAIRAKAQPNHSTRKLLVYLTDANFNNAYVQPDYLGQPLQMVLPIHSTLESDNFLNFGTVNEGNTACHEALHYVQNEQTNGFWAFINAVFGSVATPSQGLERWFTEGFAVWTEGHIDLHTARPDSPFWQGVFEGTVESRGYRPRAGDLSIATRDVYGSGAYLVGYYFVDYLVRTYGEAKLWALIEHEGGSLVGPFALGSSLQFQHVYGKTLGRLYDDFADDVFRNTPRRSRPADQHVLVPDLGSFARLGVSAATGELAVASDGYDTPTELRIYRADGSLRLRRALTWFVPVRPWIGVNAGAISGLRFSPDGERLYMVASELSVRGDDTAHLWELRASDGEPLRKWSINGFGGDLSPDGRRYLYIDIESDRSNLVEIDLQSGQRSVITAFDSMRSVGSPAYSPDGARIIFPLWTGESFDLALREPDGTITQLTTDARSNYGPRWLDNHRVVFLREVDKRWQVHALDITTGVVGPLSDAPHLAIDPMVDGDRVVFLNRTGVRFSLDSVPLRSSTSGVVEPHTPVPALPAASTPAARVVSDEPYSHFDGLFKPLLRTPFVTFQRDSTHGTIVTIGASLQGSDRLGYHSYGLNLWTDTASKEPSFIFEYGLNRFSPIFALLHVERSASLINDERTDYRDATLNLGRTFWDWPVAFTFTALQQTQSVPGDSASTRLVGPGLSISYSANETTPYAGVLRSLRASLSGEVFPSAFASSLTMGDLRGTVGVTLPLPFSRRHTLSLDLVGRILPGAPAGLLEIGGGSGAYQLSGACQSNCVIGAGGPLPGGVSLSEPLQGYEDMVFNATRTVIGSAHYRFPLIIDRGLSSLFYVLPSVWVSQVNLGLFATAAYFDPGNQARAMGATVSLYTLWAEVLPINLVYSFEYRFDLGPQLRTLQLLSVVY